MASPEAALRIDKPEQVVETKFLISNLYCPTCVTTIASSLASLWPGQLSVSSSILSQSVTVGHDPALPVLSILKALEHEGFVIYSIIQNDEAVDLGQEGLHGQARDHHSKGLRRWSSGKGSTIIDQENIRQRHVERCGQCRAEKSQRKESTTSGPEKQPAPLSGEVSIAGNDFAATNLPFIAIDATSPPPDLFEVTLSIGGMTCSSCVGTISDALRQQGWTRSVNVNLLTNSATISFEGKEHLSRVIEAIENSGYEAVVEQLHEIKAAKPPDSGPPRWQAVFAIGGMTCSSCVGKITKALQQHDWVETVDVNLISNSASIVFNGDDHLASIKQTIKDVGYEANIDSILNLAESQKADVKRKVAINISGMYCAHCPQRISEGFGKNFGDRVQLDALPTMSDPILRISYIPHAPDFTIRQILASITAMDSAFDLSIYHPPSIEQRAQEMRARERRRLLYRLALCVAIAIPTFVIGIVMIDLVSSSSPPRQFLTRPIWAGSVSRAEWALFIMATPVYFFAADVFHVRAFKELRAMWRPGSTTPLLRRFYRFGSMNMLMSLGTTIAYFSSIAELAIAATQPSEMASMALSSSYFDSVVFLTMFLLMGRFLEAYSKAKTGDAVTLLGKLRPTEAILVNPANSSSSSQSLGQPEGYMTQKTLVDLLEVGDAVQVLNGGSPPSDGTIIQGETQFDESSLTGESRLVAKRIGDTVFAGTVNKSSPIFVQISGVSGTSMLDQIVRAVREGQARRAPIERVADLITSHFVPLVVLLGVLTWIIWLVLGLSGVLPESYRNTNVGGWPVWSLQFSIAVFIIACPCGIGLAAPTALFVGGGLAAQHGILVKGGGEAFQEASALDCIVFDKTGTLTEGGEPVVTGYQCLSTEDEKMLLGVVRQLEENSSHPVAKALVAFCNTKAAEKVELSHITEIPGKGMKGKLKLGAKDQRNGEVIIGNEAWMSDYQVEIDRDVSAILDAWKAQGKSVALLAMSLDSHSSEMIEASSARSPWKLSAIFAASDQLRPEAAAVVAALKQRGIEVWMISGDNPTTARAVGKMVGIGEENVIAGVLPDQKAERIQYLQKALVGKGRRGSRKRATVAMVGDGINDAPALTSADVGIAIGSGSDVAISSAGFVLVSSRLTSLLVLIDLSRTVFRRVRFNFGWALVYNLIALPVAAGVLYPVVSNGSHIRLDPVWASLAMALSSVSVVCSSLLLRSTLPVVGFRPMEFAQET